MAFIVEMWGLPKKNGDSDRSFECHDKFWQEVLKIGRENGWQPIGTLPADAKSLEMYIQYSKFDSSYEPNENMFCKVVLSKDALVWAGALEKFLNTIRSEKVEGQEKLTALIRDDMTEDELIAANRGLSKKHVQEFIEFLKQGGFGFAWDD